jgi:hypothetical protein
MNENTGNKPEIKNKPYMTTNQDNNPKQQNQINQWFRQTNPTGKRMLTGKGNTIDNQPLIYQNA